MPTTESAVFIPALRGFRPCIIEWQPPAFGRAEVVTVLSVKDKYPAEGTERRYDVDSVVANNDMTKIIGSVQAKILAANEPVKPKLKPKPRSLQMEIPLDLPD